MKATDLMTLDEICDCVDSLRPRVHSSINAHQNLAVFRLSTCCGLRSMEIANLNVGDVVTGGSKPAIMIRAAATKGQDGKRRGRSVPLWWDQMTLKDIESWVKVRRSMGAKDSDPFICSLTASDKNGTRIVPKSVGRRWKTVVKCLGNERARQLHPHCGRHTFCSQALASGRSLVEVRDAAGHTDISMTSLYLHSIPTDLPNNLFSRPGVKTHEYAKPSPDQSHNHVAR